MRGKTLLNIALAASAFMAISAAPALADQRASWVSTWQELGGEYVKVASYDCVPYNERWPSWPIDRVHNDNCHRRVWLHENVDKTGHDICIPAGRIAYIPERWNNPAVFTVGDIRNCP
ncbi:hypothetical protein AB0I94_36260 [Streptomyces sp. NPDC050147]|uniref:hypothetical protein n=1 Tax=Streptomyces sp. NPDC050147 TaxID=3155513 RepID=UPI0034282E39